MEVVFRHMQLHRREVIAVYTGRRILVLAGGIASDSLVTGPASTAVVAVAKTRRDVFT